MFSSCCFLFIFLSTFCFPFTNIFSLCFTHIISKFHVVFLSKSASFSYFSYSFSSFSKRSLVCHRVPRPLWNMAASNKIFMDTSYPTYSSLVVPKPSHYFLQKRPTYDLQSDTICISSHSASLSFHLPRDDLFAWWHHFLFGFLFPRAPGPFSSMEI